MELTFCVFDSPGILAGVKQRMCDKQPEDQHVVAFIKADAVLKASVCLRHAGKQSAP